jgi:alpha-tubulin suppressor-like RCC1 family protein
MGSNPTGFKITDTAAGWSGADFEDVFVRKDCFLEGGLWVWGSGGFGSLGNNSTTYRSSPVQTISGGTNWRSISDTSGIKTDGTLWLWGSGSYGRLGTDSTIARSSPVQTISGGTNWKSVSAGADHTAAIKTDGTLWTWGWGFCGRLGDNSTIRQSSPVQTISGGTNWKSVSAGNEHTAAIKTDGTLWLWGSGGGGALGNCVVGSPGASSPVQTISGGTNWRSVAAGSDLTGAIKTDGTLWVWGAASEGALGNNSITPNRCAPGQTVSGDSDWKSIALGLGGVRAIKTDGTLWTWGCGATGRLANNSTISQSSPVQTISGGTNWRSISGSSGIKTDGTLWLWGAGSLGALGNNSTTAQSSPVQTISGGTSWRYACGSKAIREDCW